MFGVLNSQVFLTWDLPQVYPGVGILLSSHVPWQERGKIPGINWGVLLCVLGSAHELALHLTNDS